MIRAIQLRPGTVIKYDNELCEVVEAKHYKTGMRRAMIQTKLRNLATDSIFPETLRPDDTFEEVHIEQKEMQYLYKDDLGFCCMDESSYEQIHVPEGKVGSKTDFLKENMQVLVSFCDGEVLKMEPPIHVVLKVKRTEPGFKGDTVTGVTKPATLETGKVIKVPLFIEEGQLVKVDTRTGEYIERA